MNHVEQLIERIQQLELKEKRIQKLNKQLENQIEIDFLISV